MMTELPPKDVDPATEAFAAPFVAWCASVQFTNGTYGKEYTAQSNATELATASGSFEAQFELSAPILRPEAAELFSKVAADLESEMTL